MDDKSILPKGCYIKLKGDVQTTHFFTHKNSYYPFSIILFQNFSNYFTNSQVSYETNKNIPLVDEKIDKNIDIQPQVINDLQISIFKELELQDQISIFNQLEQNSQKSIFNQLEPKK